MQDMTIRTKPQVEIDAAKWIRAAIRYELAYGDDIFFDSDDDSKRRFLDELIGTQFDGKSPASSSDAMFPWHMQLTVCLLADAILISSSESDPEGRLIASCSESLAKLDEVLDSRLGVESQLGDVPEPSLAYVERAEDAAYKELFGGEDSR